jgi:hypothetical protein
MEINQISEITFVPNIADFSSARQEHFLTVLSGGNNNGKSLALKWLKLERGKTAYMIGTNRFYHVYHFNSSVRDPNQIEQYENQFQNNFLQENYNYEQNFIDLNQIIANLKNHRREELLYAFRGQDAPPQDSMPESSSLSDQEAVLCAADSGIGQ